MNIPVLGLFLIFHFIIVESTALYYAFNLYAFTLLIKISIFKWKTYIYRCFLLSFDEAKSSIMSSKSREVVNLFSIANRVKAFCFFSVTVALRYVFTRFIVENDGADVDGATASSAVFTAVGRLPDRNFCKAPRCFFFCSSSFFSFYVLPHPKAS